MFFKLFATMLAMPFVNTPIDLLTSKIPKDISLPPSESNPTPNRITLSIAARKGNLAFLDYDEIPNKHKSKALRIAIKHGRTHFAQKLIKRHDVNVTAPNKIGQSALHIAAKYNNHIIANMLISKIISEKGFYLEALDYAKRRPLHYAAENGSDSVLQLLIPVVKNINVRTDMGATALHYASQYGAKDNSTSTLELLLMAFADPNPRLYRRGINVRASALYMSVSYDHLEAVELLLQYGAKVTNRIYDLVLASELTNIRRKKIFLALNASRNSQASK